VPAEHWGCAFPCATRAWHRPSRVVNVSSSAHQFGTIQFDDLQSQRGYQPWRAYGQVGATHSRGLGRPGSMQGLPTAPKRLTEATGSIAARYARTAALHAVVMAKQ